MSDELTEFDAIWNQLISERSLAPAVKAVPSSKPTPAQPKKPKSKLEEALARASEVEGDSQPDEDEIAAYLAELGIGGKEETLALIHSFLGEQP